MSNVLNGRIVNYRRSVHNQTTNQMIVVVDGVETREKAEKFIGKKVIWKSPAESEIKGEVTNTHGRNGALRVHFEKGMPGQAIGSSVTIVE